MNADERGLIKTTAFTALVTVLLILAGRSFAAIHTDNPSLNTPPQADKTVPAKRKPICMRQPAIIIYSTDETGNLVPVAIIRGPMEPCK